MFLQLSFGLIFNLFDLDPNFSILSWESTQRNIELWFCHHHRLKQKPAKLDAQYKVVSSY